MKALVVVASRHGATMGIAEAIRDGLAARGVDARLARAEETPRVEEHDAVVLGSAVYMGHWLEPAREFAQRHRAALAARPVWLFSSGPLGDPPFPPGDPADVADIAKATRARGHRVFAGRLDKGALSFPERAVAAALRAPHGDWRDWPEIDRWAADIAASLDALVHA